MRVLVIEDEPDQRELLASALGSLGHEVSLADDGAIGLGIWRKLRPDVVLTDWRLPGLDGLELTRAIRDEDDGYTFIVVFTGESSPGDRVTGMRAGADDYLVKPFRFADLVARLVAAERVTALHQRIHEQQRALEAREAELRELALRLYAEGRRDALTGAGNRLALEEYLGKLHGLRLGRYSLVMFDLDAFKALNDRSGHLAGDRVLAAVGRVLVAEARAGDSLFRFGGEEFVLVLPGEGLDGAAAAAERVLSAIRAAALPHPTRGVCSVSAGVAAYDAAAPESPDAVLGRADRGMYAAKAAGRDRVGPAL